MNRYTIIKKTFLKTTIQKIVIMSFYVAIIAFFLYLPIILDIFSAQGALSVCVFSETFTQESIELFEKETGIKVNLTYVEMDELLYAKFRMNGAAGYDVVNISDYVVQGVSGQGQLARIDKAVVTSMAGINPNLRGLVYDPDNQYSVPHKWYVYGLVYDTLFFNKTPDEMSLRYIFNSPSSLLEQHVVPSTYKICMLDDARDALFMTTIYSLHKVAGLTASDIAIAKGLLVQQKSWVEAYTLHSVEYFLLAGITPIALMSSNYMRKIYAISDRYEFAIPKEGSMLIVENLAIPKTSKKVHLAQQFINFMLRDDIAALNSEAYGFNSANKHASEKLDESLRNNRHLFPDTSMFKRLHIPLLPISQRQAVEDMWLEVSFS